MLKALSSHAFGGIGEGLRKSLGTLIISPEFKGLERKGAIDFRERELTELSVFLRLRRDIRSLTDE